MINKKTQDIAKLLLKESLESETDFSVYRHFLDNSVGSVGTEEFESWFGKLVNLSKYFIQYKNMATTKNYTVLLNQVVECGYSQAWIDSIIKKMRISAIVEDAHRKEQEEKEKAEREAKEKAEREAKEKAERERLEREAKEKAERERLEREAKEKAERERLEREAKEKAERERLESEAKAIAARERV
jgi:hypothetical protein